MASIFKVVAVYSRWYLFQVVAWLGAHLRLADWMVGRQSGGAELRRRSADGKRRTAVGGWRTAVGGQRTAVGGRRTTDGGRRSAVGGRRTAVGGRRSAVGVRLTGGGPTLFGNLSHNDEHLAVHFLYQLNRPLKIFRGLL